MKVESKQQDKAFQPIVLTITIETKVELEELHEAVGNMVCCKELFDFLNKAL